MCLGGEEGVRQTSGRKTGGKMIDTKYSKRVCATGWKQHKKKRFLARPGEVDRNCITTREDSSKCGPKLTCGRRKHRG